MFCLKIGPLNFKTNHLDPFVLPLYYPIVRATVMGCTQAGVKLRAFDSVTKLKLEETYSIESIIDSYSLRLQSYCRAQRKILRRQTWALFFVGGGGARKHTRKIGHPVE